ncbi:Bro-N domain-containing protein [Thiocystis violacea]|uniref:BRO-N domain-containing protein n=1 Tax=Thiocystis violacea TaxID=13725 RepID=UPI001908FFBF|nr:Bro-N domain-containing protein [Thiocystis violacea]MBK1719217.1 hypothetical protein [Thiocystis violacea]
MGTSKSKIVTFSFDQSFNVRVIMRDGDPWFYAVDVCAALSVANARDAIAKLDDDEKMQVIDPDTVGLTDGTGINNLVNAVNESGLYTLILRCRDATKAGTLAHKFRKWVTAEVIPSIRKTGGYQLPEIEIPATLETVNSADLGRLSHIVYLIKTNFHMEGSASHAAYAHLRKQFGLEKGIASLPTAYLEQAVQILLELQRLSFAFKGLVIEAENQFIRQVLRSGKPLDDEAFNAFFDAELAKLMADHRQSLQRLN